MTTWNRASILPKTIVSILNQTYTNFELLIMDDGSTDNTAEVLREYAAKDSRIRLFKHDTPRERIISRKDLMREATGDWIYWVDSDDEIIYGTLEILKHNIEKYPGYKVFNFGQIIFSLTGTTVKLANDLPESADLPGMDHFDTGRVGTGGFVFHVDCLKDIPELPDVDNVFDFADWFGNQLDDWMRHYRPSVSYQRYNRDDKWCGNPWGDDFVFMWLLTRKFKSKKLPLNMYIAYIRTENWAYEFSDGSGVMGGSTKGV
jgi:glycosyltransferase involved in cell wall biosynthesis